MTADDILRRYLRLRAELAVPRSTNPRSIEGYLYAQRCTNCGRASCWVDVEADKRHEARAVCRYCRATWQRCDAWIPPGVIDARVRPLTVRGQTVASTASRRHQRFMGDHRLVDLCTLERLIFRVPRRGQLVDARRIRDRAGVRYWRFALFAWVHHAALGHSIREVCDLSRERSDLAWSEKRVQRAIGFARNVVQARIERLERREAA